MNVPKVSIIILNWNNVQDSLDCLTHLKKINYPNYNVVLVDNGSKNKEEGDIIKAQFPEIELIKNSTNLGFTGGCNIGLKKALGQGADYFLLLNNDTKQDPDFLNKLVAAAQADSQIGLVGPKVYFYDRPEEIAFGGGRINFFTGESKHLKLETKQEVDYIEGSSLLIKKELIQKIGYLDEKYFSYWEDTDFCLRTSRAGFKIVYEPQAKIWHKVSASTGGDLSPFSIFYLTRNRLWFMRRYAKFYHYLFFIPFYIADSLRYLLLFKRLDRIKAYFKGLFQGLKPHI